jgi:predicted nucleic acid-binding protein
MNAVVDTNVVAYLLLGTQPFAGECNDFFEAATHIWAPASWQPEILSVLWMAVRNKVIEPEEGAIRLKLSSGLAIRTVPVRHLWRGALRRSIDSGISTYDALFVELACRKGLPLATFDRQVLHAFPSVANRPSQLR